MGPEDELCICFHVTRRQVEKFLRLARPRVASQCSNCYGAGTGCGWCIPFLEKLFEHDQAGSGSPENLSLSAEEYRARRVAYLAESKSGRHPPAEPGRAPAPAAGPLADEILWD